MTSRSTPVRVALTIALVLTSFLLGAAGSVAVAADRAERSGHAPIAKAPRKDKKKVRGQDRTLAAFKGAAARLSQSGVACEGEAPPDAVEACSGKNAGDACTVEHDDRSFTGVCATAPGGVLVCQPPPPPPPSQGAIDACDGKVPGDDCVLTEDDCSTSGLCKSFATGVVACVKAPMSLRAAIDACTGKAAGDACSFTGRGDEEVTGACTAVEALGETLVCVPTPPVPPAVAACDGKLAGDACSFEHGDRTLNGSCVMPSEGATLVCRPEAPPGACDGKNEGDDCTLTHDDWSADGTCVALPFLGGHLACVPDRLIPPAVAACSGLNAGDGCSFTRDGRTVSGSCAAIPDHDLLACVPPPPQGLIDACVGKATGDACSATLGDRQFTGTCALAADGVTLACLPSHHRGDGDDDDDDDDQGEDDDDDGDHHHGDGLREAACEGLPAGALCSVTIGDRTERGLCRHDDDEDDDDQGGELECRPPAPPQEAIDACTGLASGDACSFPFRDMTVSGACRPLPGGATLVCAPLCPNHGTGKRD